MSDLDTIAAPDFVSPWGDPVPTFTYLCGAAGSGKTFLTKLWAEERKGITLCATTGIAALNLGGTTINSLLGYFDTASLQQRFMNGQLTGVLKRLYGAGLRRLIIDEVSMMDGDQLTYLVRAIEEVNGKDYFQDEDVQYVTKDPLGLTLVGDFCFALHTPITLADGSTCAVEDVKPGMRVMGVDGGARTVTHTTRGTAPLYYVTQTHGEDYLVTGQHRLVLKRSPDGLRQEWKGRRYPTHADEITITVEEFAKQSRKFRECFVGYRVGCLPLAHRAVKINPYFLGLWLGDGFSDSPRITTADDEIVQFCRAYATHDWGLSARVTPEKGKRASRIALTKRRSAGHAPNPLWQAFRHYDLPNNKHIPADYLLNDEATRLALLAGIIDSDGTWGGGRYTIATTIWALAEGIDQLAKQLGFRVRMRAISRPPYVWGGAWIITIGGDTWRIPCRIPRKQSKVRSLGRNRLTSVLSVRALPVGDYAGFTLAGDDHRFLLRDGTVVHNCQLPPVKAIYAFESAEWERFATNTHMLTEIRRQADPEFIEALRAARRGDGRRALEFFRSRLVEHTDDQFEGTTLFAKNDSVDRYNQLRLDKLTTPLVFYKSERWGKQRSEWGNPEKPPYTWGIPQRLPLKVGSWVMILTNVWLPGRPKRPYYVNGDCGEVTKADPEDHFVKVRLQRSGEEVEVEYCHREVLAPLEAPRRKELREQGLSHLIAEGGKHEIMGAIDYMPIRLAWASTTHKSQGLSLDRLQVNINDPFFKSCGMIYVALSRARTAEGLHIIGRPETFIERCAADPKLKLWL